MRSNWTERSDGVALLEALADDGRESTHDLVPARAETLAEAGEDLTVSRCLVSIGVTHLAEHGVKLVRWCLPLAHSIAEPNKALFLSA